MPMLASVTSIWFLEIVDITLLTGLSWYVMCQELPQIGKNDHLVVHFITFFKTTYFYDNLLFYS